jgi:hypothetical protein
VLRKEKWVRGTAYLTLTQVRHFFSAAKFWTGAENKGVTERFSKKPREGCPGNSLNQKKNKMVGPADEFRTFALLSPLNSTQALLASV